MLTCLLYKKILVLHFLHGKLLSMDKVGLRRWAEQNSLPDERIVWAGSPRMVYFRGLFITRVIPGAMLLGLAVWFYYGAPGIPLADWAMFLTDSFPKEIVFVLGLLFVLLPFFRAYMLRHTFYIITNQRVLKARVLSNRVRQWPLEMVQNATRIDYRDGLCTYLFDEWEDAPHRHERISRGIYFVRPDFKAALAKANEQIEGGS